MPVLRSQRTGIPLAALLTGANHRESGKGPEVPEETDRAEPRKYSEEDLVNVGTDFQRRRDPDIPLGLCLVSRDACQMQRPRIRPNGGASSFVLSTITWSHVIRGAVSGNRRRLNPAILI